MVSLVRIVVGFALLLLGRRLYWLFVGGIGFLTGMELAPRFLPGRPEWVFLVLALGLALVGTLVAIVAQKLVIALVGFLAGGAIGVHLLRTLGAEDGALAWLVYLVAGLVGIVLVLALFEWGLILLSAIAGADLIVSGVGESLHLSSQSVLVAMLVVAVIGVIVQAGWLGAAPRRRHPERP